MSERPAIPSSRVAIRARHPTSPLTIVTPRTSTSGEASARISASASSGSAPMSVSMTIGTGAVTWASCRSLSDWLDAERVDDQAHQTQVIHEILGCRLRRHTRGDNLMEILDLMRVGILVGRAFHALLVGVADRLVDHQGRWQVPDIGRVVLDANRFRDPIDLDVGVEADLLVDTRLQDCAVAVVVKDHGQKPAVVPVPRGDDAS